MKLAFSTVATPEWTLEQVAAFAEEVGYDGVELRTFGSGSSQFACDPALTAPEKIRKVLAPTGVGVACVATSASYEAPVTPPVIGHILGGTPAGVKLTGWAVDLAARVEAPLVRVFPGTIPGMDTRWTGTNRIVERLELAVATARNTGVQLALENSGSFTTAVALSELLDRVNSPLLGVAYNPAIAALDGEDPASAINVLGDRLLSVKLRDMLNAKPVALGEGTLPTRKFVEALAKTGYRGWIVHEHDAAWLGEGREDVRSVLSRSAKAVASWGAGAMSARGVARGPMAVR